MLLLENLNNNQMAKKVASQNSFASFFKIGLALNLAGIVLMIVLLLVAAGLFVGGFILVKKELKKQKEQRNMGKLVTGYVLMGLGMVVGLGFGAPIFLELLGESL